MQWWKKKSSERNFWLQFGQLDLISANLGRVGDCAVADNKGYAAEEEASLKGKYTK